MRWITAMVLAGERRVSAYRPLNHKKWHQLSNFGAKGALAGRHWEGPYLFKLAAEGERSAT